MDRIQARAIRHGTGEPTLAETLLTVRQIACLFHVHVQTARRYVAAGTLPAIRIGKKLLIPSLSVEAFLKARTVPVRAWALRRKGSPHGQA
jgi:excisionase family DNA binding protein